MSVFGNKHALGQTVESHVFGVLLLGH